MNAPAVGLNPPRERALVKTDQTVQTAHERLMVLMMLFGLLIGIILILGGLQFFPALALGPIAEHFSMLAGQTF